MSLRTAITAFGSVLTRRKSRTPLGKALAEFDCSADLKAARKKFPEQQRALTRLAERLLKLASIAAAEDRAIIGDVCSLIAAALTQQVRGEARASEDDWRWMARWPDKMFDCHAGGYDEAETLLCHLLESPWADFLSPDAVSDLLDRLGTLSDAPEMRSAKLMSLYEQYCIQRQAGDHAAIKDDGRKSPTNTEADFEVKTIAYVGKLAGARQSFGRAPLQGADASREDAAIAADGTGLVADTTDVHASEMELPIVDFVPAVDVAARDDGSVMHEYGDTIMSALSKTDMSLPDTMMFDTSAPDEAAADSVETDTVAYDLTAPGASAADATDSDTAVIDVTASGSEVPDTTVIDTTDISAPEIDAVPINAAESDAAENDLTESNQAEFEVAQIDIAAPAASVQPDDGNSTGTALIVAVEKNEDLLIDQSLTGAGNEAAQSSASFRDATVEPVVQASNDALLASDGFIGRRQPIDESKPGSGLVGALSAGQLDPDQGQSESTGDAGNGQHAEASDASLVHSEVLAGASDLRAAVQLPLPAIAAPQWVAPDKDVVTDPRNQVLAPDFSEAVNAVGESRPVRDEATIDMFDALEAMSIPLGSNTDHVAVAEVFIDANEVAVDTSDDEQAGNGNRVIESFDKFGSDDDLDAVDISHDEDEQSRAVRFPAGASGGTAPDDDHVDDGVKADDFASLDEKPASINDSAAAPVESAEVERPALHAAIQSSVSGSEYAGSIPADPVDEQKAAESPVADEPQPSSAVEFRSDQVRNDHSRSDLISAPDLDSMLDAFDETLFGDDDAVNLDALMREKDAPTSVNDDVPATSEFVDLEQPELLAGDPTPMSRPEAQGNESELSVEPGDEATWAASGDPGTPNVAPFRDDQAQAEPTLEDIFDAFDCTELGDDADDEVVALDGFLLTEDPTATIDKDVPATASAAELVRSGDLAGKYPPVAGAEVNGDDETDGAEDLSERISTKSAPTGKKLSRSAMQVVEVLRAELPKVEIELSTCSGLGQSFVSDWKALDEAAQRCAEVLKRFGSAADSVGFTGLANVFDAACERVRSLAKIGRLSETQVRRLSQFASIVRAYLDTPYGSASAQPLVDWVCDDCWVPSAVVNDPDTLLCLLVNPDLTAIDHDASERQKRAEPEDVSLAVPVDVNRDVLDGLLQELPVQCEEFSAAIERLMNGTGAHEDILVAQRIAHTIKGSGNTVGIRGLASLTHNVEDILLALAQEKRLPTQALADMLMNAADRLEAMTESLLGMGRPPEDTLEVLQCVLDWANMIDRGGLPSDDTMPQSLPLHARESLKPGPLSVPAPASPTTDVAVSAENTGNAMADAETESDARHRKAGEQRAAQEQYVAKENKAEPERKNDSAGEADTELEALLRVPARLVDQLLTNAGESIILTGQLRERVRRAMADLNAMSSEFDRQQRLGGELEKLIDVKDFSRRQAHNDISFDAMEMDQYNELHSTARQLVESATDAREMGHALVDHLSALDEMLIGQEDLNRDTQEAVLHTRMVSVKSIFPRLHRAVRQTCRSTSKQAELRLSGGDTPMDSDALARIVDPLMHLLRNAIDHDIEEAKTRVQNGKETVGAVHLDFQRDGNDIVINCRDDGAGLDYDAIRRVAEERGLIGSDVSLDALRQIVLRANFSTRKKASQVSGRGIGLDAVHNSVLALGGTMTVESESGQGCSFEMRLPFNLISSHALLVRAGPNVVALASRGVKQVVHGSEGEIRNLGDKTVFQIGEDIYPMTSLEAAIGDNEERRESNRRSRPVVLAHSDEGVTAVSVESVIGSRDLVVKSLGKLLPKFRGIVGATILGDGLVAPVIDLPDLLSNRNTGADVESVKVKDATGDRSDDFILIVEDSLSARRALAQFMQDSGYRVRTARDGMEAAELMEGAQPILVLADLEMPRMNGIELTVHLRATARNEDVPVIMITSRSTEKHRDQALAAGVNAYFTKPYSEDTLVENVRRLIREQEVKHHERTAA